MSEVKVFFKKSADYRAIPVSGVWGGATPQGLVFCDFFMEKTELPESVNMEIDEKTGIAQEKSRQPSGLYVVREVLTGLVFTPMVAKSIGQWLIGQADELEKALQGGK